MKLSKDKIKELNSKGKLFVSDCRIFAFNTEKSLFEECEIVENKTDDVNRWWYPTFRFDRKELGDDEK